MFVLPQLIAQFGIKRKRNPGCTAKLQASQNRQCSKSSSAAGTVAGSPCVVLDASIRTHRSAPGTRAAMPTAWEESTKQGLPAAMSGPPHARASAALRTRDRIPPHSTRTRTHRCALETLPAQHAIQRADFGRWKCTPFQPGQGSSSRPSWRSSHGCSRRSPNNPERTSDREY